MVPTGLEDDCGAFEEDPRLGRMRLDWETLQSIPQEEHILIRPALKESWWTENWLRINFPFFDDAVGSELQQDQSHKVTKTAFSSSTETVTVEVGFAMEKLDWSDADGDGDTSEVLDSIVENGGWYGVAIVGDGYQGLSGLSNSRRFLNGSCDGHLVFVYDEAHFASNVGWGLGWPVTNEACSSSETVNKATWIGVR